MSVQYVIKPIEEQVFILISVSLNFFYSIRSVLDSKIHQ